jgi:hypothetical protein
MGRNTSGVAVLFQTPPEPPLEVHLAAGSSSALTSRSEVRTVSGLNDTVARMDRVSQALRPDSTRGRAPLIHATGFRLRDAEAFQSRR